MSTTELKFNLQRRKMTRLISCQDEINVAKLTIESLLLANKSGTCNKPSRGRPRLFSTTDMYQVYKNREKYNATCGIRLTSPIDGLNKFCELLAKNLQQLSTAYNKEIATLQADVNTTKSEYDVTQKAYLELSKTHRALQSIKNTKPILGENKSLSNDELIVKLDQLTKINTSLNEKIATLSESVDQNNNKNQNCANETSLDTLKPTASIGIRPDQYDKINRYKFFLQNSLSNGVLQANTVCSNGDLSTHYDTSLQAALDKREILTEQISNSEMALQMKAKKYRSEQCHLARLLNVRQYTSGKASLKGKVVAAVEVGRQKQQKLLNHYAKLVQEVTALDNQAAVYKPTKTAVREMIASPAEVYKFPTNHGVAGSTTAETSRIPVRLKNPSGDNSQKLHVFSPVKAIPTKGFSQSHPTLVQLAPDQKAIQATEPVKIKMENNDKNIQKRPALKLNPPVTVDQSWKRQKLVTPPSTPAMMLNEQVGKVSGGHVQNNQDSEFRSRMIASPIKIFQPSPHATYMDRGTNESKVYLSKISPSQKPVDPSILKLSDDSHTISSNRNHQSISETDSARYSKILNQLFTESNRKTASEASSYSEHAVDKTKVSVQRSYDGRIRDNHNVFSSTVSERSSNGTQLDSVGQMQMVDPYRSIYTSSSERNSSIESKKKLSMSRIVMRPPLHSQEYPSSNSTPQVSNISSSQRYAQHVVSPLQLETLNSNASISNSHRQFIVSPPNKPAIQPKQYVSTKLPTDAPNYTSNSKQCLLGIKLAPQGDYQTLRQISPISCSVPNISQMHGYRVPTGRHCISNEAQNQLGHTQHSMDLAQIAHANHRLGNHYVILQQPGIQRQVQYNSISVGQDMVNDRHNPRGLNNGIAYGNNISRQAIPREYIRMRAPTNNGGSEHNPSSIRHLPDNNSF